MADEVTTDICNRLGSIEEYIQRIECLVENDACCVEIVNRFLLVQEAMQIVGRLLLVHHLRTAAIAAISGEEPGERLHAVEEISSVFKATSKRLYQPVHPKQHPNNTYGS